MKTLLVDPETWDLLVDASGNIAMAAEPYAIAQDAASAIKLFSGELWYDTSKGVPYWDQILGQDPPLELMKAHLENAALTVPGAVTAKVYFTSLANRRPTGQVQITDEAGNTTGVGF